MLIGMVHLLPLPGSPGFKGSVETIEERALKDAIKLEKAGFDAVIVENFGDQPFTVGSFGKEALVTMTRIVTKIIDSISLRVGINIEFNCWEDEIMMAKFTGASFVRIEVLSERRFHPCGVVEPCLAQFLRLRERLDARDIELYADVEVKHTYPLVEIPKDEIIHFIHEYADAIIYTGEKTGVPPSLKDVQHMRSIVSKKLLVGSGINVENAREFLAYSDGLIVGSSIKVNGNVFNEVSLERAKTLADSIKNKEVVK